MSKAIEEFAATTTIHGVQTFLMTKQRWFKVIWGFLMVASILAMVMQLYQTSKEFSRAPVTSSISIEAPDQWPTIMICPDVWFDPSKAFGAGFNATDIGIIGSTVEVHTNMVGEAYIDQAAYLKERRVLLNQLMAEANLITVQDMVELLTGDVVQAYGSNRDSVQLLKAPFTDAHRVCFYSSNVSLGNERLSFSLGGSGFLTVTRNPSSLGDRYNYNAGKYINVRITMAGISTLPKPTNPCFLDMDETVCEETCRLKLKKCYTSPWNVPHMYALKKRFDSLILYNPDNLTYNSVGVAKCYEKEAGCLKSCHSCENWEYEITHKADGGWVGDVYSTQIDFDLNQRVKIIRQSWAYTDTMLVSNVGGLVSWYLGASILSVAHLGFFCLSRCFNKKPQEVMAAEEGRISPVKERKKGRWNKLKRAFSRKKSARRPTSKPWVLHVSNFNKDYMTQT